MDSQRQQAAERIKQANNILVTVSNNPSVDQLAACIGLALAINKMGKHGTAVFSGQIPSALEFLQPEKTIEKNTDSLRDFIIALDKSKADKLRYKVEDTVVKIFITPYRTSISDKDLEFSQGDFNVDVVLAIGVHSQAELDQAITSHGRILHDATIITLNTRPGGELGSVNWLDPSASSLSELAVQLLDTLDRNLMDGQIATSFLTGIVAETERFSNAKTSPQTMSISAELMGAGANQQLVAMKLEEPAELPPAPIREMRDTKPEQPKKTNDGTLEIAHEAGERADNKAKSGLNSQDAAPSFNLPMAAQFEKGPKAPVLPEPVSEEPSLPTPEPDLPPEPPKPEPPQIQIDEQGSLALPTSQKESTVSEEDPEGILPPLKREKPTISRHNEPPKMVLAPPALGAPLSADNNYAPDEGPGLPDLPAEESGKPASMSDAVPPAVAPSVVPPSDETQGNAPGTSFLGDQPVVPVEKPSIVSDQDGGKTLTDIERDVHSSHLSQTPVPDAFTGAPPAMPDSFMPSAPNSPPPSMVIPAPSPSPAPGIPPMPPTATQPDDQLIPNLPVTPPAPPASPLSDSLAGPVAAPAPETPPSPMESPDLADARDAVMQAINGGGANEALEPVQALNAQPLGTPDNTGAAPNAVPAPAQPWTPPPAAAPELDEVQKAFLSPEPVTVPAQPAMSTAQNDPNAPPPVPPPMMPPMPPSA